MRLAPPVAQAKRIRLGTQSDLLVEIVAVEDPVEQYRQTP